MFLEGDMARKKRNTAIITPAIKSQIADIFFKMIGDSIKGFLARAAAVTAIVCSTSESPPVKIADAPKQEAITEQVHSP